MHRLPGGQMLVGYDLAYDADGYLTSADYQDGYSNQYSTSYAYSPQGCLESESRSVESEEVARQEYGYDKSGNRLTHSVWTPSSTLTYTCTYNDLNQLIHRTWTDDASVQHRQVHSYDVCGNLSRREEQTWSESAYVTWRRWDYTWDSLNRLVEVERRDGAGALERSVEYAYCPTCGGQRSHRIVHDGSDTLLSWQRYESIGLNQLRVDERYDADNDGLDDTDPFRAQRVAYNGPGMVAQLVREDLYAYSSPHSDVIIGATPIYYHYDPRGSVVALSNQFGQLIEVFDTDAFGRWDGQDAYTTRRLTGKEYDPETELYFFENRWYDPAVGRFISRDRLPDAELLEGPNLYLFVRNDPVNNADPTGLKLDDPNRKKSYYECVPRNTWAHHNRIIQDILNGNDDLQELDCEAIKTDVMEEIVKPTAVALEAELEIVLSFTPYGLPYDIAKAAITGDARPLVLPVAMMVGGAVVGSAGGVCFVAGTEVATPTGPVSIENLRSGDLVWSWVEGASEPQACRVTRCLERLADTFTIIQAGGEEIKTTPEHPFYVESEGWVEAQHLLPDDYIRTLAGTPVPVEAVRPIVIRAGPPVAVYNLEIDGGHNYYVSSLQGLAHNRCGFDPIERHHPLPKYLGGKPYNKILTPLRQTVHRQLHDDMQNWFRATNPGMAHHAGYGRKEIQAAFTFDQRLDATASFYQAFAQQYPRAAADFMEIYTQILEAAF